MFKKNQLVMGLLALCAVQFAAAAPQDTDAGNGYIQNLTTHQLYGQYKWDSKLHCKDSMDGNLHAIKSGSKIVDDYSTDEDGSYCSGYLHAYDEHQNLVATAWVNWYASEKKDSDNSTNHWVFMQTHGKKIKYCAPGYDCDIYTKNDGNQFYLEVGQAVKLTLQNDTTVPLYVNYDHISGNCGDDVDLSYQKVSAGKSFTDKVYAKPTLRGADMCQYVVNIDSCSKHDGSCRISSATYNMRLGNARLELGPYSSQKTPSQFVVRDSAWFDDTTRAKVTITQ